MTTARVPEIVDAEVGAAWRRETWRIVGSRDDVVFVEAWLAEEPGPVVVVGHGAESDRRAPFVSGTGKGWARHGISLIAADAPGHGDRVSDAISSSPSGGGGAGRRPAAEGVDRGASDAISSSLSGGGGGVPAGHGAGGGSASRGGSGAGRDYLRWWIDDQRLVVDAAERRLGSVPIGFLGVSMGAVLGVHLVAAEPRIAAAVLAVGGSLRGFAEERTRRGQAEERLSGANPEEAAFRCGDRPVLMVQADEDEVFSRKAALALYDAFPGRKEITFFPGTHAAWRHPGQWNRRMLAFFHETLRGAADEGAGRVEGRPA